MASKCGWAKCVIAQQPASVLPNALASNYWSYQGSHVGRQASSPIHICSPDARPNAQWLLTDVPLPKLLGLNLPGCHQVPLAS